MKKLSLKLRLMLFFLIIAGAVWAASGVLAWLESREQTDEFFDTYQLMLARQLATADWNNIKPNTQKSVDTIIDKLEDDGDEEDEAIGLAVFDAAGNMVFHDNENGRYFRYVPASGFVDQMIDEEDEMWRIVWVTSTDGKYIIAVGQELDFRNDIALEMIEATFIPWVCGLGVLLIAIVGLISKEFLPLKKLAQNIAGRESDNLAPIEEEGVPKEVLPLVQAMNALLAKIADMLQRERSFIADSAHELRSPLTALKVQLDVAELAGNDKSVRQKALNNLREGIERSSRLVEQMLALSKLDAAHPTENKEDLNWGLIIGNAVEEQQSAATEKNIDINVSCGKPAFLDQGQSFLWSLLLRNLLDNAIRYSGEGATINIELNAEGLEISNNKTMLNNQYLPRLGERFFRPAGQQARGSGLGLSIVEKIAALHGCKATYSRHGDVFSVRVNPI